MSELPPNLRLLLAPLVSWLAKEIANHLTPESAMPAKTNALEWLPIAKCGIPKTTARQLVKNGKVGGSRVGRELYVNVTDIKKYIEGRSRILSNEGEDDFERALQRGKVRSLEGGRR